MASERINLLWDPDLIARYDLSGPRYTSYPTALAFSEDFNGEAYERTLERSRASGAPLSLYLHIPFCAHLCYYCACNKIVTRKRTGLRPIWKGCTGKSQCAPGSSGARNGRQPSCTGAAAPPPSSATMKCAS